MSNVHIRTLIYWSLSACTTVALFHYYNLQVITVESQLLRHELALQYPGQTTEYHEQQQLLQRNVEHDQSLRWNQSHDGELRESSQWDRSTNQTSILGNSFEQQQQQLERKIERQQWLLRKSILETSSISFLNNSANLETYRSQPKLSNSDHNSTDAVEKYRKYKEQFVRDHPECSDRNHSLYHFLSTGESNENFDHDYYYHHGCRVNPDTNVVHCHFKNFIIDLSKIQMKAIGGESVLDKNVRFRPGIDEYPTYLPGAFTTRTRPTIPPKHVLEKVPYSMHYVKKVLEALQYPNEIDSTSRTGFTNETISTRTPLADAPTNIACKEVWNGTTLFLTRYEYANLYHTMTDWWNTFFSLPPSVSSDIILGRNEGGHQPPLDSSSMSNPSHGKYRIVFLDGHAHGHLDDTWRSLFGTSSEKDIYYIRQLPSDGLICFDHAVLIPPGYSSRLFPHSSEPRRACVDRFMADQFVAHVLRSYQLHDVPRIPGRVVIIDRQPYVAHSRSQASNFQRTLSNLLELKNRLLKDAATVGIHQEPVLPLQTADAASPYPDDASNISVRIVRLESLSFKEQIQTIREAHILIGNHGAGLTHLLWMHEKSHVLELTSQYVHFFEFLSQWRWGVSHSYIPLLLEESATSESGSKRMSNETMELVVAKVRSILEEKSID